VINRRVCVDEREYQCRLTWCMLWLNGSEKGAPFTICCPSPLSHSPLPHIRIPTLPTLCAHTHIPTLPHTTQSTGVSSYVLNDRLFPIPVHDCSDPEWSHCPTCEGKHKRDPSPTRYVRCVILCVCVLCGNYVCATQKHHFTLLIQVY